MAEKILRITVIAIVVIIMMLIATSCSCNTENKEKCVHCGCELKTDSEKESGICGGCLSTINSRCDNTNYNYNER